MTIVVRTVDGTSFQYQGTGWHIDDHGHLHIRKTSGNAGTIHRDHWVGVGEA